MALYAFDGTWNAASMYDDQKQQDETNVALFSRAYEGRTWYVSGPNTLYGEVGRVIGGAGSFDRVEDAYTQLCGTYAEGDTTIDIVGFSRGAALALDFVSRIRSEGVRRPHSKEPIERRPAIRFMGLWDVVGALGMPLGKDPVTHANRGHQRLVPDGVEYCFHALAMDERRPPFRATRLLNAYEVWFRGAHADVGGGNGNTAMSGIALRWMLSKARAAGLPITAAETAKLDKGVDRHSSVKPQKGGAKDEARALLTADRVHYTVVNRTDSITLPETVAVETEDDERQAIPLAQLPRRESGLKPITVMLGDKALNAGISS